MEKRFCEVKVIKMEEGVIEEGFFFYIGMVFIVGLGKGRSDGR